MPTVSEKTIRYTAGLALAGLTVFLGYFVKRADFVPFISAYGAFFGLYVWLLFFKKNKSQAEIRWYIGLGIALRLLLLFSIPNLSDDFYRFLWDGHLTVAGIHPFAHTPDYFVKRQIFPEGINPELFARLNSPEYHTVYPPVCQAVFALAAWLSLDSVWVGVLVMKLFLLVCETGSIWLLVRRFTPIPLLSGAAPGIAYALNPLILLEIAGNCHFEGAMIFFLLAGLWALEQSKLKQAAVWWALAAAAKLVPLMFVPILWRRLGWRKGWVFSAVLAGVSLVLFAPLWSVLPNILSSLDLYFRQFQFNASVYYLLRGIGFWVKGFDIGESLGPFLGLATVVGVLWIAWCTHRPAGEGVVNCTAASSHASTSEPSGLGLYQALLCALLLQLCLSATVHPWYVTVPFAIGLLTRWRFPIVWTGLAGLSYSHYADGAFLENYWLIALEYSVLWVFILWEADFLPLANRNRRP